MNFKLLTLLACTSLLAEPLFYGNPPESCPPPFRIYVMGDYLYWQASEMGLEYAAVSEASTQAKTVSISYPYKDGFRLGGGVVFAGYDWQLEVDWTRFYHNLRQESIESSPELYALWMHPESQNVEWKKGIFSWDLKFDALDIDLLRVGFVNENFSLTPYIGLLRAWIEQNFHVRYESALDADAGLLPNAWYDVRTNNDFRCIGPKIGFDTRLWAPYDFNLILGIAAALCYGEFHLHRIDMSSNYTESDLIENINRFKPAVQALAAIEWNHCFAKSWRVLCRIGYEAQAFWGQNQQWTFLSEALPAATFKTNGTLIFKGLGCHARFDF